MIGFSLRLKKHSLDKITALSVSYEDFLKYYQKSSQVLYLFEDSAQNFTKKQGVVIYAIGTLIYKGSWGSEALDEIANDLHINIPLNNIIKKSHGQFCLIVFNNNGVKIVTDKLASFPIYLFEDDSFLHFSNIFLNIVRNNPVTFNYQAISEYCSFDYCFNATFFNEIKILDHGQIYSFDGIYKQTRYENFLDDIHFERYTSLEEATEVAKSILIKNFRFLEKNLEKKFIDLTGGLDSRLTASILNSMNVKFEAGICGEQIINEGKISNQICDILGVMFHNDIKIRDSNTFSKLTNKHFEISNGIPLYLHSTELLNYYKYIKNNFNLHISGFAGSQIFDNFLPRISFISNNLRPQNLIRKYYLYKNIFKNKIINERDYHDNMTRKINDWLDRLGTRVHDRAATYYTTTVFSKFYHGSIIGAHNTILPVYVPYLESDLVRLMIASASKLKNYRLLERNLITIFNKKVSEVITSHGYTANVNTVIKGSMGQKIKDEFRKIKFDIEIINSLSGWIVKKTKPPSKLAELQRDFWVDQINSQWSNDMSIFDIIDKGKLDVALKRDDYGNKLKAKVLYLNRLKAIVNS